MRRIGRGDSYELWNATDVEIARREEGRKYYEELPKKLKESVESYHRVKYKEYTELEEKLPEGSAQALYNFLGHENFEDVAYDHYGLDVYETEDGEEYAVGTEDEVESAVYDYYVSYVDEFDHSDLDPEGDFVYMYNQGRFIDDEVDYLMEDYSEDEILEMAGKYSEVQELREKIDSGEFEEDEDEDEISHKIDVLIDESEDDVREQLTDEWEDCLYYGVVDCLINTRGWFSNVDELVKSGVAYVDENELIEHLANNAYYGETLGHYDGEEHGGYDFDDIYYYIFRIN
jgi:hypothetical protein